MVAGWVTLGVWLVAVPVAAQELPRVTGIAITGFVREAMLTDRAGRTVAVREGDRYAGYVLSRLQPGEAVLTGADGVHVLRPAPDAASRDRWAAGLPSRPPLDAAFREQQTESNQ